MIKTNDFEWHSEWHSGRVVCVISPNSIAFGPHCIKVVEDTRYFPQKKRSTMNVVSGDIYGNIHMGSPLASA